MATGSDDAEKIDPSTAEGWRLRLPIWGLSLADFFKFTANTGDTYSLFGAETPVEGSAALNVSLFDNSTETSIYSYSNSGSSVVTADSIGGPTANTLAAGDYTFTLNASLSGPEAQPFLTGNTPTLRLPMRP